MRSADGTGTRCFEEKTRLLAGSSFANVIGLTILGQVERDRCPAQWSVSLEPYRNPPRLGVDWSLFQGAQEKGENLMKRRLLLVALSLFALTTMGLAQEQ